MNIPASDLHNPIAPWNTSDLHFDEIVDLKKDVASQIDDVEYQIEVLKEDGADQKEIDLLDAQLDEMYNVLNN
jgi:hypothetical protein